MTGRVAIFVPSMRGGGAERVMLDLAGGLARSGLDVDLVLARAEGPFVEEASRVARLVDLGAGRVLAALPGLVRYLRRERPVAMLSALSHANVVAVAARTLAGVPVRVVVSERGTASAEIAASRLPRGRMLAPFMRWAYRRADAVVAVSEGVADDLAELLGMPRERIEVIYNPIVSPEIAARAAEPFDHPWLAPGMPPVILAVGRLAAEKDFATLVRAFDRVRSARPARLVILGEGGLRSELEALVRELRLSDDVALPGFASNPFVWMKRASLFVLSSVREGLPGALVQAMACGVPVVSTDCRSGPREILEGGKWGRLVPVRDEQALADAIVATLDEPVHPDVALRASAFGFDGAIGRYRRVMLGGGE